MRATRSGCTDWNLTIINNDIGSKNRLAPVFKYKGAAMTSKQRAYLKGLAMNLDPVFQIGKASLTPEVTQAVAEALEARELIKITVLKNCLDDGRSIADVLAERTHSQVVQVIGRKIVLYRPAKDEAKRKIVLPK